MPLTPNRNFIVLPDYRVMPGLPGIQRSIQNIVCNVLNTNIDTIKAHTRKREVVRNRQIIFYFLYKYDKRSLAKIAIMLDLNHATVVHSYKLILSFCRIYKDIFELIQKIDMILIAEGYKAVDRHNRNY